MWITNSGQYAMMGDVAARNKTSELNVYAFDHYSFNMLLTCIIQHWILHRLFLKDVLQVQYTVQWLHAFLSLTSRGLQTSGWEPMIQRYFPQSIPWRMCQVCASYFQLRHLDGYKGTSYFRGYIIMSLFISQTHTVLLVTVHLYFFHYNKQSSSIILCGLPTNTNSTSWSTLFWQSAAGTL